MALDRFTSEVQRIRSILNAPRHLPCRKLWCLAPVLAGLLLAPSSHGQTAAASPALATTTSKATPPKATAPDLSTSPDTASAVSKPASTTPRSENSSATLQEQIARLPPLTGTTVDVPRRSTELINHLNALLRFYRAAVAPVQKAGEPSDVLYAQQSSAQATQIAHVAFQAAKNEAALLDKVAGPAGAPVQSANPARSETRTQQQTEVQRLNAVRAQAMQRISDLQAQDDALAPQLLKARGAALAALQQQQGEVQGQLELQKAMIDALGRINTFSEAQASTGLGGEIARLQQSAPELAGTATKQPATPVLQSLTTAHDAGVATQAQVLFALVSALHESYSQTHEIDQLSVQADDLRTPIVKILRSTIAQGEALAQAPAQQPTAAPTKTSAADARNAALSNAQQLAATRKRFDQLTATFQVLSTAALPLSQEVVLLENERGTLTTWSATVNAEYKEVLRGLLLHLLLIAAALGILAVVSNLWNRATVRYVGDLRRRRQLLFVRRTVVGFLSGLVLIFGFVTQFSSLATFAGFITAGIAVGLQSILLSIAAYFFIVGRYGVRVGDRITVTGVTGDVIEVGLVRFYMMELVGTGTELHSTGRVAVFANSVLFQTGTPLYKQMPGTEYAWHELTAKLKGDADVQATSDAILGAVNSVYSGYRARIESQHQQVEAWMGTALPSPKIESRLQLVDGGLQFAVLFPVELNNPAGADQGIAEQLVKAAKVDGPLKTGLTDLPIIKAAVKS